MGKGLAADPYLESLQEQYPGKTYEEILALQYPGKTYEEVLALQFPGQTYEQIVSTAPMVPAEPPPAATPPAAAEDEAGGIPLWGWLVIAGLGAAVLLKGR